MRKVSILLLTMLGVFGVIYWYPVGGSIWRAGQVTAVALGGPDGLRQLQNTDWVKTAAEEAVTAARMDRFRRFIPGMPEAQCVPLNVALKTAEDWVHVELHCTSGLVFDYIDRGAWR